jgi:ribonuclease D
MITLKDKFDKKDITLLPKAEFKGKIFIIISEKESDKAVQFLLKQKILGIDTETRPSFRRGQHYKVALLQVSTHDTCFLFRLNRIGITDSIKKLLEDCNTIKVGLSLKDDLRSLSEREDFVPGMFIDIQNEVKEIGIQDLSLQKIYANLFGMKITKNQQLTNWEADALTEAQKTYAATDAWACIQIYEEIKRLKITKDYIITKTDNTVTSI